MEYFKIALFFFHIYLELNIFPSYLYTYLNPVSISYLAILLGVFYLTTSLRKYGIMSILIVVFVDVFLALPLITNYYDKNFNLIEQTHFFLIYGIVIFSFLLAKLEDFKQIKKSYIVSNITNSLFNMMICYSFFYHFKNFHFKDINKVTNLNNNTLAKLSNDLLIDIVILLNYVFSINVIKIIYTKKSRRPYFFIIIKKIFFVFLATTIYYLINSDMIRNYSYEYMNTYIPQPHNIILYNLLPSDNDQKTRLGLLTLLYAL